MKKPVKAQSKLAEYNKQTSQYIANELQAVGYINKREQYKENWYLNGELIASDELFSMATSQAYKHYIDNLPHNKKTEQENTIESTKYTIEQVTKQTRFGTDYQAYALIAPDGRELLVDRAIIPSAIQAQAELLNSETANLRMRNMELEAALEVTTESLNKANYEKYLLEVAIKEAIEKSIPKDTTLGDCAWALTNCRETLKEAIADEKQAPVADDSDEQYCPSCFGDGNYVNANGIAVTCPDCNGLGV